MSSSKDWTATRISRGMWNVYQGEDCEGYIASTTEGWWAVRYFPDGRSSSSRKARPSAYQAAKDMWGEEAATAVV